MVEEATEALTPTPTQVSDFTRSLWTSAAQHMSALVAGGQVDAFSLAPLLPPGEEVSDLGDPDLFGELGQQGQISGEDLAGVGPQIQLPDGTMVDDHDHVNTGSLAWGGHANGRIPESELMAVKVGNATHRFEPTAGSAFQQMVAAAAKDGVTIRLTDSYRTYDQQVHLRNTKGHKVATATPGTSIHGWGRAIDVAGDAARKWIQQNGARFGWIWPEWAQRQGTKSFEPWHFEFRGGGSKPAQPAAKKPPPPGKVM